MAQTAPTKSDRLIINQQWIEQWWRTTLTWRIKAQRDFEYAEGNGRQWDAKARKAVTDRGQPALEYNHILPQIELVCGMQRGSTMDFAALPRGGEDKRFGEIVTASLKAAEDFTRAQRVHDKVFDDGIICGLGAWEVSHTFDDPDDLVWGDVLLGRLNPMAFIYDTWAVDPDRQDGRFMGKAVWQALEVMKARYPGRMFDASNWQTIWGSTLNSDLMGTGANLLNDLWQPSTGQVRVFQLWYKVPTTIALLVDKKTGQVSDVGSKANGAALLDQMAETRGRQAVQMMEVVPSDSMTILRHRQTGQALLDATGRQPMQFVDHAMAAAHLDTMAKQAGMPIYEQYEVLTRKARAPRVSEMIWNELLSDDESPYTKDRKYPFVPYVSRQFMDDPESIQGLVRPLRDPQDGINKYDSNMMAHLNSTAHSGWLNRKAGGANKKQLELMGSKPGVVVEYATTAPTKIEASPLSEGHFRASQDKKNEIRIISGVNSDMSGTNTQVTVSGRAIQSRQAGGATILKPRMRTFEEALLDVEGLLLSRIQQYFPPEKLRRIIGRAEINQALGANGQSIFTDPVTGQPLPEDAIMAALGTMKDLKFDLVMKLVPATATERQMEFQLGVELAGLITSSGRPLGPQTMTAMVEMSDAPAKLVSALKADMAAPPTQDPNQTGGQNAALQGFLANIRGGKAGGQHGSVVGGP